MNLPAERLQQAMTDAGFSQSSLARAVGVTQGAISQVLLGRTNRSKYLPEIAQILNVSIAWLRGGDVPKEPQAGEALPRPAVQTIMMSVNLPSEGALAEMFDALLRTIDDNLPRSERARLLAQRLPIGLRQLQGPLDELDMPSRIDEAEQSPPPAHREQRPASHI